MYIRTPYTYSREGVRQSHMFYCMWSYVHSHTLHIHTMAANMMPEYVLTPYTAPCSHTLHWQLIGMSWTFVYNMLDTGCVSEATNCHCPMFSHPTLPHVLFQHLHEWENVQEQREIPPPLQTGKYPCICTHFIYIHTLDIYAHKKRPVYMKTHCNTHCNTLVNKQE